MNESIRKRADRTDGPEKTAGRARYIADLKPAGMLHALTVRSDRPRARILDVRVPELPDGYTVVDHTDVPGKNRIKMLEDDWPFFAESLVNHVGDPILLIVGPDRTVLHQLADATEIDYQDMDPVLTLAESEAAAQPIFNDDNCFAAYSFGHGALDEAFADAHRIIEGTYTTGYHEQAYMEPQGVIGAFENGKVTVHGSMQCPYYIKNALMQVTGLDETRVQVVQATTGGAFGGKEEYPSLLAGQVAVAAMKTGKPVQLILERGEDMVATTKRHPSVCRYRTAVDTDGTILAMEADITLDGGAYAGLTAVVLQRAMFAATGVYRVPAVRVTGRAFATNHVPSGAFRGFGAPQAFFAVEMHMEDIALKLEKDPLRYKLDHLLRQGDQTCTGGILRDPVRMPEMVDMALKMADYERRLDRTNDPDDPIRHGIGTALTFHGCGFTGKGEEIIKGTAGLRKREDGVVEVLVANVEMGQGASTTLAKIVAAELDIPLERVIHHNPDTDKVPDSGPTVASRTIMIVGGLLQQLATELKPKLHDPGDHVLYKTYRHPSFIEWDQDTMSGDAYPAYSWGVTVVAVALDTITGEVDITDCWTVFDVGTAIDPDIMQGQIEGGVLQGLGYAYLEVMDTRDGHIRQHNFTDYIIPTAPDSPRIQSRLVDNPYQYGPFGAKCAGELPLVGAAPAFNSALRHASGLSQPHIPVRPETLLERLS